MKKSHVRCICQAVLIALLLVVVPAKANGQSETTEAPQVTTVTIFDGNAIHFLPDDPQKYATGGVASEDNGRVIVRSVQLPEFDEPARITARVAIRPIPKDERSEHDRWDRAGNVRLAMADRPDIELVKFITAYGGATQYDIDITHLAPLLHGECTFKGFIDTWVSPAWEVDFSLSFTRPCDTLVSSWVHGLVFEESFDLERIGADGIEVELTTPDDLHKVKLFYLVSGHCTDGRGADEFVPKDNVISVDGRVVYRFRPWRDDCRQFREINPYCARWSDGWWSSDFSRSGWCPGDAVAPNVLDLTDHLTAGEHTVTFRIDDIRPKDENGHYGYWRVSGYVVGWTE